MIADQMMAQQFRLIDRLRASPTGMLYGFSIRWGDRTVSADGFFTREQMRVAREAEFDDMAASGWTQPRWWQFWRAADTRR